VSPDPAATVTGLTVYPVKSMRGIPLKQARLTPAGLEHDRRFMVTRPGGRFVTQRDLPRLALIETRLEDDGIALSVPDMAALSVPFERDDGEPLPVRIWGQECAAVDQGETISRWLTEALHSPEPLRLVAMAPGFVRPQGKPADLGADTHTLFADAAPFLVANEASLAALNGVLGENGHDPVPMNRFRPNVVLDGPTAFAEHTAATVDGPGYALRLAHPCQRCLVTTIDQATAERDPQREPYQTLVRLNPIPGHRDAPAFGQNASLSSGPGATIRVGDRVTLTGR
jgi:hypothetical protein